MAPDERTRTYLEQVLRLDSGGRAQAMLDLRAAHLGGGAPSRVPRPVLRQDSGAALDALRSELWSLDDAAFRERARAIDVATFPHLQRELAGLERAHDLRSKVDRLSGAPSADPFLVKALKEVIAAPRAETGTRRDVALREAMSQGWRRRRVLRRAARRIARDLDGFGATERDLVQRMARLETERRLWRDANRTLPRAKKSGRVNPLSIILIGLVVIGALARLLEQVFHK
jgi:hypothetical protein